MSLTKEELMHPRFMVIADWPDNYYFQVGGIISLNKLMAGIYPQYEFEDCKGTHSYLEDFFKKYPHLFKPLQWWEERNPEDMPQYAKRRHNGKSEWVVSKIDGQFFILQSWANIGELELLPSDELEYTAYQSSQKLKQ